MNKTLNIVNGDACINIMKSAGIQGDFLPWRDFLHEGPVPAHLSLKELSEVRAKFISEYGLGKFDDIYKEFIERDQKLSTFALYHKIVLWFEHDLYDQLQLLQILAWFAKENLEKTNLTLICTNNYLGESSAHQIQRLQQYETTILKEHLQLAHRAWHAFRESSPTRWVNLMSESTALLPFLKTAIYRMLQEYPSTHSGLSRSAYQALMVIDSGADEPLEIFNQSQALEERRFMGDVIFWKILENFEKYGVIKKIEGKLMVTALGKELLNGKKNWLAIMPKERYIGGVKLSHEKVWCWDEKNRSLDAYYFSKSLQMLLKIK